MNNELHGTTMPCKVVLLTNIPTPYRVPLWKELSRLCDLEVICISKTESNRQWKTENSTFIDFLPSFHVSFPSRDWFLHFTIPFVTFYRLFKANPRVVILTGYDSFAYWEALLYIKLFRKRSLFWNGSTQLSSQSTSSIIRTIKNVFIHQFDSYYTYGSLATKYLNSFGVHVNKIVTGRNTVDTPFFKSRKPENKSSEGVKNLLFVGQLIERKGVVPMIKALSSLDSKLWSLRIIGEGLQKDELVELVNQYGIAEQVQFLGYKKKSEIIDYYYSSDILLMPSFTEVWGLVLNEALSAGLFCLSSRSAGATIDLIEEGINGFIVDPEDIEGFSDKIDKAISLPIDKEKIQADFKVDPKSEAMKIHKAIEMALDGRRNYKVFDYLKKIYRVLKRKDFFYKRSIQIPDKRYGTEYGGWWVSPQFLEEKSIILSFGLGEDISFDTALIEEFQCSVHGFDPTPKSLTFLDTLELPEQFHIHPVALSDSNGSLTFNLPQNSEHVSGSLESISSYKSITVPCQTIKKTMEQLGIDSIDMLKMDIEGSEYKVLKDMVRSGVLPKQLLIEYHHFFDTITSKQTKESIELLYSYGYELFHIEAYNYSFIHKSILK